MADLRFRPITCSSGAFCGMNGQLAQMLAAANSQPHEGGVFGVQKQSLRIYWKQPFLSREWREGAVDRPMVGGAVPCAPHGIISVCPSKE